MPIVLAFHPLALSADFEVPFSGDIIIGVFTDFTLNYSTVRPRCFYLDPPHENPQYSTGLSRERVDRRC